MIESIGTTAGQVWRALDEANEALNLKELKKITKVRSEKLIFAALGWLAKEGKLEFEGEDPQDFTVRLKR